MAEGAQRQAWYFGVICERCTRFIPVGRDPSDGVPGQQFAGSGTVIASCPACSHRGRYAASRVEQRRSEPRRAEPRQ